MDNVKTEGMTGGMNDQMMCCQHDPIEILRMFMENEQYELALYNELVQIVPSACLKEQICAMIAMEACKVQMIAAIAAAYNYLPPVVYPTTPFPPTGNIPIYYAAKEKEEE